MESVGDARVSASPTPFSDELCGAHPSLWRRLQRALAEAEYAENVSREEHMRSIIRLLRPPRGKRAVDLPKL